VTAIFLSREVTPGRCSNRLARRITRCAFNKDFAVDKWVCEVDSHSVSDCTSARRLKT